MQENETEVRLEERVYQRLLRARREGESISDVILRLTSTKLFGLQRRGVEEIVTADGKTLSVSVDQDLCMGAESCVGIAPEVFALDESQLGRRSATEPLGVMDVDPGTVESERIVRAARSCPYKAITVQDKTGAPLAP